MKTGPVTTLVRVIPAARRIPPSVRYLFCHDQRIKRTIPVPVSTRTDVQFTWASPYRTIGAQGKVFHPFGICGERETHTLDLRDRELNCTCTQRGGGSSLNRGQWRRASC
jgi:hypothetical protein